MIHFNKNLLLVVFLFDFKIHAMSCPTAKGEQIEWINEAYDAIKNNRPPLLKQAMLQIRDDNLKKHLFRKIVREKPRFLLLMEAALESGLDVESHFDKETLLEFVRRKNDPAHIAIIEKYRKKDPASTPGENIKTQTKEISLEKFQVISRSKSGKIRLSLKEGVPLP